MTARLNRRLKTLDRDDVYFNSYCWRCASCVHGGGLSCLFLNESVLFLKFLFYNINKNNIPGGQDTPASVLPPPPPTQDGYHPARTGLHAPVLSYPLGWDQYRIAPQSPQARTRTRYSPPPPPYPPPPKVGHAAVRIWRGR